MKVLVLLVSAAIVLSIGGCGQIEGDAESSSSSSISSGQAAFTTIPQLLTTVLLRVLRSCPTMRLAWQLTSILTRIPIMLYRLTTYVPPMVECT